LSPTPHGDAARAALPRRRSRPPHRRFVLVASLLLAGCAAHRTVTYVLTPDVTGENRARLIDRFDKGKVLYKVHCSGCHGIFGNARDTMPDFTEVQFDNYKTQYLNADPTNHAVKDKLSQQQLDYIFTFLRLLKRPVK
jgi:mono/diheme cytochrome c family protein